MVVFSTLRAALPGCRNALAPLTKRSPSLVTKTPGSVRFMGGHGNKMAIKPSTYEYTLWKDHVHKYLAIALIPMACLITTVNVFVGRAELADIPEGYEPDHWEYHQHPISRWFAKNVYGTPQKEYEKTLHLINTENTKRKLRLLESRVRQLMAERGDYKGWYYIPVNERKVYVARNIEEARKVGTGSQ